MATADSVLSPITKRYANRESSRTRPVCKTNLPKIDDKFFGRDDEFAQLRQLLSQNRFLALSNPSGCTFGGQGKSAMAIAFGWHTIEDYPGGILYINSHAEIDLRAQLARTVEQVKPDAEGDRTLLIVDDVENASEWEELLRSDLVADGWDCLLTTNLEKLLFVKTCCMVGVTNDEGARMLARYRADAMDEESLPFVQEIVDDFAGLPVAIALAGTFMSIKSEIDWSLYRNYLRRMGLGAFPVKRSLIDEVFDDTLDLMTIQQRCVLEQCAMREPVGNRVFDTDWLCRVAESNVVAALCEMIDEPTQSGRNVVSGLISLQLLQSRSSTFRTLTMPQIYYDRLRWHVDNDRLVGSRDYVLTDGVTL